MTVPVRLSVRVIPNAKKTQFDGYREGELLLRLNAPPRDGKANKLALKFVAEFFGIPRSSVLLVSGEKSRHKMFQIVGLQSDVLERKLTGSQP